MNILLTSVTADQVRAEVRVLGGHRLTAFSESFNKPADYFDWQHTCYTDQDLDIGTHFTCYPLQAVQLISRSNRSTLISEWGPKVRFYHWHDQPQYVLAYAEYLHLQPESGHRVHQYQIPLPALLFQEWFKDIDNSDREYTAIIFVGGEQSSLALFQGANLVNHASIQFRSAEDILYHYLFSLDQFSAQPDACTLHLIGPRAGDNALVDLFDEQTQLNRDFFASPEDAERFDLKLLWKCAS